MGQTHRTVIAEAQRANFRWKVSIPQIEEELRNQEQIRVVGKRLIENGFAPLAVKIFIRNRMNEDLDWVFEKVKSEKTFQEEYAKIIILRNKGEREKAIKVIKLERQGRSIEEIEQLGIELSKLDPNGAKTLVQAHLDAYPKNIGIAIFAANVLKGVDPQKSDQIRAKIKEEMSKSEHSQKITNRGKIATDQEGELTNNLKLIRSGRIDQLKLAHQTLFGEGLMREFYEMEDVLKGEYFEITDQKITQAVLDQYLNLKERAKKAQEEKICHIQKAISEGAKKGGSNKLSWAANEFKRVEWKFLDSQLRKKIATDISDEAIKYRGSSIMLSVSCSMAVEAQDKGRVLQRIKVAREYMNQNTIRNTILGAIENETLDKFDAQEMAKEEELYDPGLATRIRIAYLDEPKIAKEMFDFLLEHSTSMTRETLGECTQILLENERIRKGEHSKEMGKLLDEYSKKRGETVKTEEKKPKREELN